MTDEQKAALVAEVTKRLNSLKFYRACGARTECAEGRGCESCLAKEATAIVHLVSDAMEESEKHESCQNCVKKENERLRARINKLEGALSRIGDHADRAVMNGTAAMMRETLESIQEWTTEALHGGKEDGK